MSDDLFRVDHAADAYLGDEPPDLGPLRALAERAELADAVSGLTDGYGCRLADSDPFAPLARRIACDLVEAGFTLHHCAQHHPLCRLGGVCLLPVASGQWPGSQWQGRGRGVLDDSRSAVARLGPMDGVPQRARSHEWRARPGARCVRVSGLAVRPGRRVDRDWPRSQRGDGTVSWPTRPAGVADRVIQLSTAMTVFGVAGIAAYLSYEHAFEVIAAHGEIGMAARLEPATVDGLVYSSSVVIWYAARHQLAAPVMARCLLALGIVATLAANVAHGWSHGPVGAVVAAWPAVSLVGTFELVLWIIRAAAANAPACEAAADRSSRPPDHPAATLRLLSVPASNGLAAHRNGSGNAAAEDCGERPVMGNKQGADRVSEPDQYEAGHAYRAAGQMAAAWTTPTPAPGAFEDGEDDINAAAVAAYRTSIETGRPLSERKLAQMFGKTSRRWARNRMAEARQALKSAMADSH